MKILIAGGGEVGYLIAQRLIREGNEVTLVEADQRRYEFLDGALDARVVHGNAASIRVLRDAGLQDAEMLIAATTADEVNLLACLIAQVESNVRYKLARIRTHEADEWRRICHQAGIAIDLVIHPESEIVHRILPVLRLPGVSDIRDFAGGRIKLFGMNVENDSGMAGKSMEELQRQGPPKNSLIAMIFRGAQVIIPRGGDRLESGDHVYVVTTEGELEDALRFMGVHARQSVDRVFIVGGKQVGIRLAQTLERRGKSIKLFEQDAQRCLKISQLVKETVIVNGDGTDEATLMEENIEGVDAFLALTNDDEDNIIACLLARKLGARKVVALINRLNYLVMAQRLGINTTVSPRLVAVDRTLRFIRKGGVVSVTTFRQEEAEAIELVAPAGSRYVGKRLRDLRFPEGAIVGAVARPGGEAVVPRGDAVIEAGDRVIFFALERVVPKLESAFLVERGSRA
jgi:trk system potassium uptake protein TrkA